MIGKEYETDKMNKSNIEIARQVGRTINKKIDGSDEFVGK